jgi:MoxR-like ATPase
MEKLFMVLATQNPVEQEGTYPLPEAQLDRFVMKILITYPDTQSEKKILELVREESKGTKKEISALPQDLIFNARKEISAVKVTDPAEGYIVDLINGTRYPEKYSKDVARWISYGASPRGSIALEKCSRVVAWMDGRNSVTPDDIRYAVNDVLRHRLILSYEANADRISPDKVIEELLKVVVVT